jgi:nitrogen fixation NifU-like protein
MPPEEPGFSRPAHSADPAAEVSQRFLRHATQPRGQAPLAAPSGQATGVGVCGDSVQVGLEVADGVISRVRAEPHGCIYTVACASALAGLAQGLTLEQALEIEPQAVVAELGGLPEDHLHCARLVVNTLGEAVEDHLARRRRREPGG